MAKSDYKKGIFQTPILRIYQGRHLYSDQEKEILDNYLRHIQCMYEIISKFCTKISWLQDSKYFSLLFVHNLSLFMAMYKVYSAFVRTLFCTLSEHITTDMSAKNIQIKYKLLQNFVQIVHCTIYSISCPEYFCLTSNNPSIGVQEHLQCNYAFVEKREMCEASPASKATLM